MTRRAVMGSGIGVAVLSGCSLPDASSTKTDTADRDRLVKARDLSQRMLADIEATTAQGHQMAEALLSARALHATQIAQFAKSAKASNVSTPPGAPLTAKALRAGEQALVSTLRTLALEADRGDVAALLASAAAGIDQILAETR